VLLAAADTPNCEIAPRLGICAGTLASDGAITGRRVCRRPGGAELSEAGAQGRWTIMPADEDAMRLLPGGAWQPGTVQDGSTERDKDTAEITNLMTRAGNWLDGRRWIVRRVKRSRRQMRNLTAYEKEAG
jgi:hypothetical protein